MGAIYLLLVKATALSFSGFASVRLVREDLVSRRAVPTDDQLNSAIAISQASPGPLGLYVVVVGYCVAGVPGAAAAIVALASPALLAIPIAVAVRRGRSSHIRGASIGIVIVSCVLMVGTALELAPTAAPSVPLAIVSIGGLLVLALTRVPPILVILCSAAVGLAVQ